MSLMPRKPTMGMPTPNIVNTGTTWGGTGNQNTEIKRRKRFTEIMQKLAQPEPTQVVTGVAVRQPSWGGLAKGLAGALGAYSQNKLDDLEAQQENRRSETLARAIEAMTGGDSKGATAILAQDPTMQDKALEMAMETAKQGTGVFGGNSIDAQMANQLAQAGYSPVDIAKMHYTRTMTLPGGGVIAVGPEARGLGKPNQQPMQPSVPMTGQTGRVMQPMGADRVNSFNPAPMSETQSPADVLAGYENMITGLDGGMQQPAMAGQQPGVNVLIPQQLTPDQQLKMENDIRDRQSDIGSAKSKAQGTLDVINQLLTPEGKLKEGVGSIAGGWFGLQGLQSSMLPLSENQRRYQPFVDQMKGQAFLNAFESLKGGGQITQVEGEKATQAIARLAQYQSDDDFAKALTELRDIAQKARDRAASRLSTNMTDNVSPSPQSVQPDAALLEFMTPEERALFQ